MMKFIIDDAFIEVNVGGETIHIETVTGKNGIERVSSMYVEDNASGKYDVWMTESDWSGIGDYPVDEIRYGEL